MKGGGGFKYPYFQLCFDTREVKKGWEIRRPVFVSRIRWAPCTQTLSFDNFKGTFLRVENPYKSTSLNKFDRNHIFVNPLSNSNRVWK